MPRFSFVNTLQCSYCATSNNMKFVHWPLMGGPLHLVQQGGAWAGLTLCTSRRFAVVLQF